MTDEEIMLLRSAKGGGWTKEFIRSRITLSRTTIERKAREEHAEYVGQLKDEARLRQL